MIAWTDNLICRIPSSGIGTSLWQFAAQNKPLVGYGLIEAFSLLMGALHGMFEFMCIDAVERPLVVRWIVGSIPHGGPIKLFLVAASAQRLV